MRYTGTVLGGSKYASSLGFPTINIPHTDPVVTGVFAARVVHGEETYIAAAFADPARGILEAHLLDFSGDLYGEEVEIELVEKIRDTQNFDTDAAMRAAITADVSAVRAYFERI